MVLSLEVTGVEAKNNPLRVQASVVILPNVPVVGTVDMKDHCAGVIKLAQVLEQVFCWVVVKHYLDKPLTKRIRLVRTPDRRIVTESGGNGFDSIFVWGVPRTQRKHTHLLSLSAPLG